VLRLIKGDGFELNADESKVKAKLIMVDSSLAIIVLKWLDKTPT